MNLTSKLPERISRRKFLLAAAGALAFVPLAGAQRLDAPVQTSFRAGLMRGTTGGLIQRSLDAGQSWHGLANFGPQCAVTGLSDRGGQLLARLEVAGHPFLLVASDGKTWRSLA